MYDSAHATLSAAAASSALQERQRSAFSDGDLATASPAKVLIRCFDRLDTDLDRALAAIEEHDHETANRELGHAQDLLGEVAAMLDVDAWEHAESLLAVYDYVLRLLAAGNILKNPVPVSEARHLLAEIGDGFRTAATAPVTAHATAPWHPVAGSAPADVAGSGSTLDASADPSATPAADLAASTPVAAATARPARTGGFSVLA